MPGIKDNSSLTDSHVADVMTYIRNAWGNKSSVVGGDAVKKVRAETETRELPYTEKELR